MTEQELDIAQRQATLNQTQANINLMQSQTDLNIRHLTLAGWQVAALSSTGTAALIGAVVALLNYLRH